MLDLFTLAEIWVNPAIGALGLLIIVLFGVSGLAMILWNIGFYVWLRRRGVSIELLLAGTPGYKETRYLRWCKATDRRVGWPPIISGTLLAVFIASAILFAAVVVPSLANRP